MNSKSKLDALGDVLGVTDDTRDIERPKPGRGLSAVLGDKMVVDDDAVVEPHQPPPSSVPRAEQPVPPTTPRKPGKRATPTATPTGATKKTSATIPVSLVRRLRDAKQKRWDLTRLVADALATPKADHVTMAQAEAFLEASADEPRAVESFRMPTADLDVLDKIGDDWRMNRSQILSAVLDRQLKAIGY